MSAVAERPQSPSAKFRPEKYLSFQLAEETYAICVEQVLEIIQVQPVTPVPDKPHYIKGVMNLRGKVIPVVDMRLKFQLGDESTTERTCVIVVEVAHPEQGATSAGLIVDAVDEVTFIAEDAVEEDPGIGSTHTTDHVMALAKIRDKLVSILDIDRVILEEIFDSVESF
ncbi:MAG: chemotaxis protein CheW [Opitutales bacterium]|nr:chemotaxis protein CheW [Opitutales bacterium]NRA26530.1 purine-binding chemotaxis protein CheW [Opitutales bacterium]